MIILDKLNLKSDGNLIALFRNHLTSIIKIMDIAQDVVAVIYFTNMNQLRPLNQSAAILTLALSPGY
jgi:transcriptional regulatory protein LevR